MTISTRNETPVFFDADGDDLFGIFTEPEPGTSTNGPAVLALWGAGGFPTFGKNQVRRRLAHRLAEQGFASLRIDYRGIGESGGDGREVDMADPWVDDALGAVRWLEGRGFERVAIIGMCFGGRTALAAADRVPELAGLALVAAPVGQVDHGAAILERPASWYLNRAFSPGSLRLLIGGPQAKRRRRLLVARLGRLLRRGTAQPQESAAAGSELLGPLESVLRADVPVLFLYGRTDDFYPDFERARSGVLGRILDGAGRDTAFVRIVDHHIDGLPSVDSQEAFVDTVIEWVSRGFRLD
ncbi:MAG: alpha/beta hydrolase [Acidimicrobiales bacterium]